MFLELRSILAEADGMDEVEGRVFILRRTSHPGKGLYAKDWVWEEMEEAEPSLRKEVGDGTGARGLDRNIGVEALSWEAIMTGSGMYYRQIALVAV